MGVKASWRDASTGVAAAGEELGRFSLAVDGDDGPLGTAALGRRVRARRLDLNPGTVRNILSDLGLLKPRGIHPLKEKVRPLVEGGMTLNEAAKVLGVSPTVAK